MHIWPVGLDDANTPFFFAEAAHIRSKGGVQWELARARTNVRSNIYYNDNEMKKDGLFNLKQYSKPLLFLG